MALVKRISELTAKGSNVDTTDLIPIAEVDGGSPSGYTTKYVTGAEISSGGTNTLYNANDTIGSSRIATITDKLTFDLGQIIRSANGTSIVEVTDTTHLPSTLASNTTYVIRGLIRIGTTISVTNSGSAIVGLDRTKDKIQYTGTGTLLDVADVDFSIRNVGFTTTTTGKILTASNYTAGVSANNYGRTKILQIFGCEFKECYNLLDVTGFELVDFNNNIFWYVTGSIGLQFKDVRHLEITSCELFNWFDLATGTTYSTASMIELLANGVDNVGFAVININSCIIHPEQTQNGIDINSSSTTSFGTISSNTLINVGLTTGELFLPIVSAGVPDYSQTETYNFDIFTNQGILNSTAGLLMTMNGNTTDTSIASIGVPVQINTGTNNNQTERVRWSGASDGTATYLGTKQIYVSIHGTIAYEKVGGGTDSYTFYIYKNGVQLTPSELETDASSSTGTLTMTYATLINATDQLKFYVANNDSTSNILIKHWQIVIRE